MHSDGDLIEQCMMLSYVCMNCVIWMFTLTVFSQVKKGGLDYVLEQRYLNENADCVAHEGKKSVEYDVGTRGVLLQDKVAEVKLL